MSLVDEDRLQSAKETEIVEVDSDIMDEEDDDDDDQDDSDRSQENTYENTNIPIVPKLPHRSIYDVIPTTTPLRNSSSTDQCHSTSSTSSSSRLTSTNEQQIIDIDTALREVLSGIRTVEECHAQCFRTMSVGHRQSEEHVTATHETDAPDLVQNLPISSGVITPPASKSLDAHQQEHTITPPSNTSPINQANHIVQDSARTSRSNSSSTPTVHFIEKIRPSPEPVHRKKIPPPIMKKPEKTVELLKRLGLPTTADSSCGTSSSSPSSTLSSSSSSSSSTSTHAFLNSTPVIPVTGASKTTDV